MVDGIVTNRETRTQLELARYMPGSPNEVTHALRRRVQVRGPTRTRSTGRLVRRSRGPGRHRSRDSWFNGTEGVTDPPVGQMVEVREEPGLDRSTCRYGAEGPLQIWADPEETTFFALAPGHWGVACTSSRTTARCS